MSKTVTFFNNHILNNHRLNGGNGEWNISLSNIAESEKNSLITDEYPSYDEAKQIYDELTKDDSKRNFISKEALPAEDAPVVLSIWQNT